MHYYRFHCIHRHHYTTMQIEFDRKEIANKLVAASIKHAEFIANEMNRIEAINQDIRNQTKSGKECLAAIMSGEEKCTKDDLLLTHPDRYRATMQIQTAYHLIGKSLFSAVLAASLDNMPLWNVMAISGELATDKSGQNDSNIHIHSIYHWYKKPPSFHFSDALTDSLEKTDISKNIPASFITPPSESFFISFGKNCSKTIANMVSGDHVLEGAYICFSQVTDTFTEFGRTFAEVTPESQFVAFDVMFTGRPKDCLLNDCAIYTTFYFDLNSDESIPDQLNRNRNYCEYILKIMNKPSTGELLSQEMVSAFELLITCIVYLNCADIRREFINEKPVIEKKLSSTKNPKKIRRLKQDLRRAQEYTLISSSNQQNAQSFDDTDGSGAIMKPHYRRGFLRAQRYGEKNSKIKIIRIEPTMVNRAFLGSAALPKKTYMVK